MPANDAEILSTFNPYIAGAVCTMCLVAAMFFLRFFYRTRDVLFLCFAGSFLLQTVARVLAIWVHDAANDRAPVYILRVISYGLILFAIFLKNRSKRPNNPL